MSGYGAGSAMFAGSGASQSMMMSQGIDRRYQSIRDIKDKSFKKDMLKNEADIRPDKGSTIKI